MTSAWQASRICLSFGETGWNAATEQVEAAQDGYYYGYSRVAGTGAISTTAEEGQINFYFVVDEGYSLTAIATDATTNYKNFKWYDADGVETAEISDAVSFRLTKIKGNIDITVTVAEEL